MTFAPSTAIDEYSMTTRRDFLRTTAIAGGALGLGVAAEGCAHPAQVAHNDRVEFTTPPREKAPRPLRILILGGTGFIGPYQVQYALDRGHTITLFNRGKTNPKLFPTVEKLIGDRNGDLKSLEGRQWDAVIDNSVQTDPHWVTLTADLLKNNVRQYVFVSTLGLLRPEPRADDLGRAGLYRRDRAVGSVETDALRIGEGTRREGGGKVLPRTDDD